jgi:hypothetical protein
MGDGGDGISRTVSQKQKPPPFTYVGTLSLNPKYLQSPLNLIIFIIPIKYSKKIAGKKMRISFFSLQPLCSSLNTIFTPNITPKILGL